MWRDSGGGADHGSGGGNWFSNLFGGLALPSPGGGGGPAAPPPPAWSTAPHQHQPRRRFTLEELRSLCAILDAGARGDPNVTPAQEVEAVRALAEYMLWADQHGDDPPGILDFFLEERNVMRLLARALAGRRAPPYSGQLAALGRAEVARQVLQTVGIVVQSVRSAAALYLLLSGGRVNALLEVDLDLEGDDEALGHYASLIKTLGLRLDAATVPFFLVLGGGEGAAAGEGEEGQERGAGSAGARRRRSAALSPAAAASGDDDGADDFDGVPTTTAAAAAGQGRRATAEEQDDEEAPQEQQQQEQQWRMAHARFPLYTRAIALAHHRDGMVRAAARTVTLCVFGVREQPPGRRRDAAAGAGSGANKGGSGSSSPPRAEPGMGNAAAAAAAAAGLTSASIARVSSPGAYPLEPPPDEDDDEGDGEGQGGGGRRPTPRAPPPPHHPDVTAFVTLAPAARGYFDELAAYLSRQAVVLDGSLLAAAGRVDALFVGPPGGAAANAANANATPAPGFTALQQAAQAALSELDSHLAEVEDVASYAGDVAAVAALPVSRALGEALWRGVVEPLVLRPVAAANEGGGRGGGGTATSSFSSSAPPTMPLGLTTALYVAERLLVLVADGALAHRLIAALLHPLVLPGLLAAIAGGGCGQGGGENDDGGGVKPPPLPLAEAVAAARQSHFALRLVAAAITSRHASPELLSGLLGAPAPRGARAAASAAAAAGGGSTSTSSMAPSNLPILVREVEEALSRILPPPSAGSEIKSTTNTWPPPPEAAQRAARGPLLSALSAALAAPANPPAAVALAAFALHELGAGCEAPPECPLADAAEACALAAVDAAQAALAQGGGGGRGAAAAGAPLERGMWPDALSGLLSSEWPAARERALRPRGALLRASAEALLCAPHAQPMLAACAPPPRGWVPLPLGGGTGAAGGMGGGASPDLAATACSSRRRIPLPPEVGGEAEAAAATPNGLSVAFAAAVETTPQPAPPPRPCSRVSSLAAAATALAPSAAALRVHARAAAALASAPDPGPALPYLSRSAREAVAAVAAAGRLCAALQAADLLRAGEIPPSALYLSAAGSGGGPEAAAAAAAATAAATADVQEGQVLEAGAIGPGNSVPCLVSFAPGRERRVLLAVVGGTAGAGSLPAAVLADPGKAAGADNATTNAARATVLSVAPLVSTEASPDANVPRWLHVHVRPSLRGLMRVVRAGGGASTGGTGAGGGGGGGAGGGGNKRGGVVVAARALADGHWVLAFADAESAAAAAGLLRARAAQLRRDLSGALAPLIGLEEEEAEARGGGGGAAAVQEAAPVVLLTQAAAAAAEGEEQQQRQEEHEEEKAGPPEGGAGEAAPPPPRKDDEEEAEAEEEELSAAARG